MKISEVRELTTDEIIEKIDTEKTHLFRIKMNHAVSPLDNPKEITRSKKSIARLKTELKQRMLNDK